MAGNTPSSPFDDFMSLLKERGLRPEQLASFLANRMGNTNTVAPLDAANLPGFDFMSRVSRVAGIALAAQTELANRAWADALTGSLGFESAMRTWSRMASNYYDVLVEVSRGPGYVSRPAWIYFDYAYSPAEDRWEPDTLKAPAKMDRARTPETEPAPTEFISLEGKPGSTQLFKSFEWVGNELTITLDTSAAQRLDPGFYLSFVFAKGRSGEAPLAIMALRVSHKT